MLNFGNKEFRNLQEQVLKNAQDIETLQGRENLQIVIVEELPEEGNPNYIYLIARDDGQSPDVYEEYIWLADEERYESIGGVTIDLTNYVTLDSEQTITGAKTFTSDVVTTGKVQVGASGYNVKKDGSNMVLEADGNPVKVRGTLLPNANGVYDLGSSALYWKNLYLSGTCYLGTDKYIYLDSSNRIVFSNNANRLKIDSTGNVWFVANAIPLVTSTYDLGSSSNYWKDFYIVGSLKDGVNSVAVADIATKPVTSYASGTFDANGESTIDISNGEPEGLFIFTYGNCQCFLRLTATMVQNADTTPIRVSCPLIYNGAATLGWLEISRTGTDLTITVINNAYEHVDSGYAWTLVKTGLL